MKKTLIVGFASIVALLSNIGWAQGIVGNGGDAVLCAGDPQVRLLDFFEAHADIMTGGLSEPSVHQDDQTLAAYLPLVGFWLSSLEELDPRRFEVMHEILREIAALWSFTESGLTDASDTGDVITLPEDCLLEQLALQKTDSIVVAKHLWDRMDWKHRAGLVLHELVYREALRRGHTDSSSVRKFVVLLATELDRDWLPSDYLGILGELNLNILYQRHGAFMLVFEPERKLNSYKAVQACKHNRRFKSLGSVHPFPTPLAEDSFSEGAIGQWLARQPGQAAIFITAGGNMREFASSGGSSHLGVDYDGSYHFFCLYPYDR